jgi:hypothetical protein
VEGDSKDTRDIRKNTTVETVGDQDSWSRGVLSLPCGFFFDKRFIEVDIIPLPNFQRRGMMSSFGVGLWYRDELKCMIRNDIRLLG